MQYAGRQHHPTISAITILTLLCVLPITCGAAEEMTGLEIMDEISRRHEAQVELESLTMILIDKKGKTTNRTLHQYSRKNEDGLNKYLLVFDDPKGIKGVALLTWEKPDGDDDQWLYLPALGNQLKRIAAGGRMNYFMGTDFAFEDLVSEQRDNFDYERQADQKLDDQDVYIIEARPNNPDLVTGYEKRQLFVRKDNYHLVRVDFFQRRTGKLLKRLTVNKLEHIDGDRWRATDRLMESFSKKHSTQIITQERSFAEDDVPESVFAHRFITSKRHMR